MAKVIQINTDQPKPAKNPSAVALGRLGGLKGGDARAAKLSPADRKAIAQRAAKQRWARVKSEGVETTAVQAVESKEEARLA